LQGLTSYSELELIEISEKLKTKCKESADQGQALISPVDSSKKNKENMT
jgi:hypothetical protein